MKRTGLILAAIVLGCATAVAEAPSAEPSVDEIVNALDPHTAPATRSLRGIEVVPGAEPSKPSIDLTVNFEFDSAELKPDALQTLKRLGEALRDARLAGYKFGIAGHTDAKGSEEYNQSLSERRANAVRQHLIFFYDIALDRLTAVGYGKTRLLDPSNPDSSVNRRVQIVNEGH